MLRKTTIALGAMASIIVMMPHSGFAQTGPGVRSVVSDADRDRHFYFGSGFWGPGYYDGYWGYPGVAGNDSYAEPYHPDGSCRVVQRRVHTSYGWRVSPVQVCG